MAPPSLPPSFTCICSFAYLFRVTLRAPLCRNYFLLPEISMATLLESQESEGKLACAIIRALKKGEVSSPRLRKNYFASGIQLKHQAPFPLHECPMQGWGKLDKRPCLALQLRLKLFPRFSPRAIRSGGSVVSASIYSVAATTDGLAATASPSCHQGPLPVAREGTADLESVELLKKPSEI